MRTFLREVELFQVIGVNKNIDGYFFSKVGRSHIESGTVCQDYSLTCIGEKYCFAAVADGIGSAKLSQIGSKTAVETVYSHCKNALDSDDKELLLNLLREGFLLSLENIKKIADESGNDLSDYDTTLTVALFDGESIIYGHIGDGGLVAIDNTGQYYLLTVATKGESYNEVIPLRADSSNYTFEIVDGIFCGIALFTDGVFDTVCPPLLKNTTDPIYRSFIKNFLSAEMVLEKIDIGVFKEKAIKLLESENFSFLHDDLSVAVLINRNSDIVLPPVEYFKEPDWEQLKRDIYYKLYPHLLPKEEVEDEGI